MNSILEKITLYDVLGYFLPGSLVMSAVCGILLVSADERSAALYQDHETLFVYAFILMSYISGILLSEISRMIMMRNRESRVFPIPDESIKQALANAGIIDSQNRQINIAEYLRQMYIDIQNDNEYKRIHNYASAEVMYKNLALAIPISAVLCTYFLPCLCGKGIILMSGMIGMRIAWIRCKRFYWKKQDYAVCCYAQKYLRRK